MNDRGLELGGGRRESASLIKPASSHAARAAAAVDTPGFQELNGVKEGTNSVIRLRRCPSATAIPS